MKVLVACEFSGTVRDSFTEKGHHAVSCDIIETESSGHHIKGDVLEALNEEWDLMIAHPPCTHLAVSGARWFPEKRKEQKAALTFFKHLLDAPIKRICVENPVSIASTKVRKPDQIIQPWQFGHGETKTTCLWLKNLPPLKPTKIVEGREHSVLQGYGYQWNSVECKKARSKTFEGIAKAMADQWGNKDYPIQTRL